MKTTQFAILLTATMCTNVACSHRPRGTTHKDPGTISKEIEMTNEQIVRKFLGGFNDASLIQESLDLLADDYKFKNPMVELNSKEEFIPLAQSIGAALTGLEVIHTSESGDWVATFYVFRTSIPGVEASTASEWFRVEDGVIKESHLIYDASEWRKVYATMETP